MLAELRFQDHSQQLGPGTTTGDRMKWCRRLGDALAGAAGEFLAHRLDDLPLARDHLQRFRNGLTELDQPPVAARTNGWTWNDDAFARQVGWQRPAHRLCPTGTRTHIPRCCWLDVSLGGIGLQLLELQLQLVEQSATALRCRTEPVALQLGDQRVPPAARRYRQAGCRCRASHL